MNRKIHQFLECSSCSEKGKLYGLQGQIGRALTHKFISELQELLARMNV